MKYFLFGSTAERVHAFLVSASFMERRARLVSPRLRTKARAALPLLAVGIIMTVDRVRIRIAAAPFHLVGAGCLRRRADSERGVHRFRFESRVVCCSRKNHARRVRAEHGSAAWHAVGRMSPIVAILSAFSILLGNFVALAQKNVRRLLAYSAVAHAGLQFERTRHGSREGFSATLFYSTGLRGYAGRCALAGSRTGATRDRRRRLAKLRRLALTIHFSPAAWRSFCFHWRVFRRSPDFSENFISSALRCRRITDNGLLWLVLVALFGSFVFSIII